MDNVTENRSMHRVDCQCAVCTTTRAHQSEVAERLREIFTPGLKCTYKIAPVRSGGFVAVLTFISKSLDAVTVSRSFRSKEQAERWISTGADAADSVALSSGGPCNTATLSPAGEFQGKSSC